MSKHFSTTNINFYTTPIELEKQYLDSLQIRQIDKKFLYVGKNQARSWLNLCESPEYTYYKKSYELLNEIKTKLNQYIRGDVNLISLGLGDAKKDILLANEMLKTKKVGLFGIDISKELINVAVHNASMLDIPKEAFVADMLQKDLLKIISDYIRKTYYPINLYTFLGNTFGNYPQASITKILRDSMRSEDLILIGVHVHSAETYSEESILAKNILTGYKNKNFHKFVMGALSHGGLTEDDGELELEYNSDRFFPMMKVVEQYFKFKRSKIVRYLNEDVYFAKGERILASYSNKYTFDSLQNLLTAHGFKIVQVFRSESSSCVKLLCQLA